MDNCINKMNTGSYAQNYNYLLRNKQNGLQNEHYKNLNKETSEYSDLSKDREAPDLKTNETKSTEEKEKTNSKIIVKPDGSRVLVVTMNMCGNQTTMSIEISKPTDLQNDVNPTEEMKEENTEEQTISQEDMQSELESL